jgi:hypothetical protein
MRGGGLTLNLHVIRREEIIGTQEGPDTRAREGPICYTSKDIESGRRVISE